MVQRRLILANVSPRLMADYRADVVSLDPFMALTITDDHAAQEAAFYEAPEWQRSPHALRDRLTECEIDAQHPLVRFVGMDAYKAAVGGIRRDLFADGDAGVYLTDAALLETMVRSKLDEHATTIRAEGWAWVDATPSATYADLQAFYRAPRERRTPNKREAQRVEKLQEKMQAMQVAGDGLPQDSAELFAALLAKPQDELVRLLAVCVAATVDVVTPRAAQQRPGEELAQAVGLDMAAWCKPTSEGYFQHIPKAAILQAVEQ